MYDLARAHGRTQTHKRVEGTSGPSDNKQTPDMADGSGSTPRMCAVFIQYQDLHEDLGPRIGVFRRA